MVKRNGQHINIGYNTINLNRLVEILKIYSLNIIKFLINSSKE